MKLPWLLGSIAGVAVLALTQHAFWGLVAGLLVGLGYGTLARRLGGQVGPLHEWERDLPPPTSRRVRTTPIAVVCRVATPTRQEWASVKTGRLYDVLSANGLAGARPGDKGQVTLTQVGWKIDPPTPAAEGIPARPDEVARGGSSG